MNVIFHVLTGAAVAATLSPEKSPVTGGVLVVGLVTTAGVHGLLDYIPHSYPINSAIDVGAAVILFCVLLIFAKAHVRPLLVTCFLGSIVPDLIDLGPGILNRHVGLGLPEVKVFPWHWRQYSGSIYDGTRRADSNLAHATVLATALGLIWRSRDRLFAVEH
jgi:hypothetical protein